METGKVCVLEQAQCFHTAILLFYTQRVENDQCMAKYQANSGINAATVRAVQDRKSRWLVAMCKMDECDCVCVDVALVVKCVHGHSRAAA